MLCHSTVWLSGKDSAEHVAVASRWLMGRVWLTEELVVHNALLCVCAFGFVADAAAMHAGVRSDALSSDVHAERPNRAGGGVNNQSAGIPLMQAGRHIGGGVHI